MIQVVVKTLKGEPESFDVDAQSSVGDLQQEIHMRLGYPAEHQMLLLGRRPLTDHAATLESAGIKDCSCVTLLSTVRVFSGHPADALDEYDRLMRQFVQDMICMQHADERSDPTSHAKATEKNIEPVVAKVFEHYDKNCDGKLDGQEAMQFLLDFATQQTSFMVFMCKCMLQEQAKGNDQLGYTKPEESIAMSEAAANTQLEKYEANKHELNMDVFKAIARTDDHGPEMLSLEDLLRIMMDLESSDYCLCSQSHGSGFREHQSPKQ